MTIDIPYHLAIPPILCVAGLIAIIVFRQSLFSKNKWAWISAAVFLTIYLFSVGSSTYHDIYYQWDLNRYDLDNDGMFGEYEITMEQEAAFAKLTNNTGRNFSVVTGFLFALFISGIVYIVGRLKSKLIQ